MSTAPNAASRLAALLDAWHAYPHPGIADLVEIAGRLAAEERRPPPNTGTLEERQQIWLAAATRRDPIDLTWLLDRLAVGRGELMRARLAALSRFPRDPRIATALISLCLNPDQRTRGNRPVWTRVFQLLHRDRDPRIAGTVTQLLERPLPPAFTDFEHYLTNKLRMLARVLNTVGPLPIAAPAAVAAIEVQLGAARQQLGAVASTMQARTAEELLREIWAAPKADGPREVFADWLLERNDPRGELITLQLAHLRRTIDPSGIRRVRALLAAHARIWIGELEPAVSKTKFVFERGFLARCEVDWRRLTPSLMRHPAWATVHTYELSPDGEQHCDPWLDHMIALGAKRV